MVHLHYCNYTLTISPPASVCFTTIVRTTTLVLSAKDRDPTCKSSHASPFPFPTALHFLHHVPVTHTPGGPIPATVWSVIEANSGIICACLPKLRRPLSVIFPCLASNTYISDLSHHTDTRAYRLGSKSALPPTSPMAFALDTERRHGYDVEVTAKEERDGGGTSVRSEEGIHICTTTNVSATYLGDGRRSSRSDILPP